jgi:hypothetical protein
MSRLKIELPDDLAARLAAASERQHVPPSQIVQEALVRTLPPPAPDLSEGKSLYDAMVEAGALGCISTGIRDLSTNPRHMEGYGRSRK